MPPLKQSLAGYVRQHLVRIENQLAIGIRQESIIAEMEKDGQDTTLSVFRNALTKARKKPYKSPQNTEQSNHLQQKAPTKNDVNAPSGFEIQRIKDLKNSGLI